MPYMPCQRTKERERRALEALNITELTFSRLVKAFAQEFVKRGADADIPQRLRECHITDKKRLVSLLLKYGVLVRDNDANGTKIYRVGEKNLEGRLSRLYKRLFGARCDIFDASEDDFVEEQDILDAKHLCTENYGYVAPVYHRVDERMDVFMSGDIAMYLARPETHIMLEFRNRKVGWCLYGVIENPLLPVRESYGIYDGVEHMATEIAKAIRSVLSNNSTEDVVIINHPTDWASSVIVKIIDTGVSQKAASYNTNSILGQDGRGMMRFSPMVLSVRRDIALSERLQPFLSHEIQHAFEDYMRAQNGGRRIGQKYKDTSYGDIVKTIQDGGRYSSMVAETLYRMMDFERNAYIAQMVSEFKQALDTNATVETAEIVIQKIKETDTFKAYENVSRFVTAMPSIRDKNAQQVILDTYNRLAKVHIKDYPYLCIRLDRLWDKVSKRFSVVASKVAYSVWSEYYIKGSPSKIARAVRECLNVFVWGGTTDESETPLDIELSRQWFADYLGEQSTVS